MFTVEQVKNAIAKEFSDYGYEFYDGVDSDEGVELPQIDKFAYGVDREGGYEGGGDYMEVVFKIDDQYFRMTGTHNSWDANEWDGELEEVSPYQELVTKYRSK